MKNNDKELTPAKVLAEFEIIEQANNGILSPRAVVEWAEENVHSELHNHFLWDNNAAASEYRLWQARQLIKSVTVEIEKSGKKITTACYVSLTPDRNDEGGYRPIKKVLNNKQMREQMLKDAYRDLRIFQNKYSILKELSEVFVAIGNVLPVKKKVLKR